MKLNISPQFDCNPKKGFTLIEMALIIAALGIFVSISAIALQSLSHSRKTEQNRKILSEYDRSVRGFLAAKYRIVCPDMDDDGIEDFIAAESGMTSCADYTGYLPYRTLGLPSGKDVWGNIVRFSIFKPESEPASPGLVINEIHYDPDDYKHEFLEIYNNSGSAIDLSGYQLDEDIELTFPDNTTIAAEEYIVCARDASDAIWDGVSYQVFEFSNYFAFSGDIINLIDKDSNVVDSVIWDNDVPWPAGHEYETYSIELLNPDLENDYGGNWSASNVDGGTPGEENSVYDSGAAASAPTSELVINEIHYDPDDYKHEFLEIYNNSGSAIDLSGYQLDEDIELTFPDNTTIAEREYIVCARDASDAIWDGVSYQVFEFSNYFAFSGDIINLIDKDSNVVDSVTWDNDVPWPEGHEYETYSIELLNPDMENDAGVSWAAGTDSGGTPGAENSVYLPDTGANNITDDTGLCSFLASQPNGYSNEMIYIDNATGVSHNQAYIIVSGGPKDLDDRGGFFDGNNCDSPEEKFESPDKITTSVYDDFVTSVSFEGLYNEICTSSGEVK